VTALRQHVQVLELKIAASERVRQHLEAAVREMSAELNNTDGSKESLRQYRARLAEENQRLTQLLAEEAEARRAAETAQVGGIQAMWTKFQNTIAEERQNFTRLEESRKALVRHHVLEC
jgi:myosin heavy chain 9/10/11/14